MIPRSACLRVSLGIDHAELIRATVLATKTASIFMAEPEFSHGKPQFQVSVSDVPIILFSNEPNLLPKPSRGPKKCATNNKRSPVSEIAPGRTSHSQVIIVFNRLQLRAAVLGVAFYTKGFLKDHLNAQVPGPSALLLSAPQSHNSSLKF